MVRLRPARDRIVVPRLRRRATARRTMAAFAGLLTLTAWASACSSSPTSPTPLPPPGAVDPDPALSISCPADQTTTAASDAATAAASFATPAATGGTAPVTVACTPASGSMFPVGATAVSCTATDAISETASCGFTVNVNPPPAELSRTTFLAFGDSLTAGEVTSPVTVGASLLQPFPSFTLRLVPSASYPAQLATLLTTAYPQQSDISVTNAGKSGEWAANAFPRFESEMRKVRPDVVLLLSGYNEIISRGTAGIPLAAKGVEAMAREARLRGAVVFVATLPPPSPDGQHAPSGGIVYSYNDRLRSVARGEGATIVDLYGAMRGGEAIYIGADGIHPTEAGYRKMAEVFFAAIQARLEVR